MIAHFRKKIVKTFQNKKHGQIETQFQASTGKEKSERIYSTREKFVFDVLQSKKKVYSHYFFSKWWHFGG